MLQHFLDMLKEELSYFDRRIIGDLGRKSGRDIKEDAFYIFHEIEGFARYEETGDVAKLARALEEFIKSMPEETVFHVFSRESSVIKAVQFLKKLSQVSVDEFLGWLKEKHHEVQELLLSLQHDLQLLLHPVKEPVAQPPVVGKPIRDLGMIELFCRE